MPRRSAKRRPPPSFNPRMEYAGLDAFVRLRMRMSHVYQPVMLITLLRAGGNCPAGAVAKAILLHDRSQVDYNETTKNNMVGRVLRSHDIVGKRGAPIASSATSG